MKKIYCTLLASVFFMGFTENKEFKHIMKNESEAVRGKFKSGEELTREQAAVLIQNAFNLVNMPYRVSGNKDVQKTHISTDTSIAMLEGTILPAASDVDINNWSKPSVETVIEARLMEISEGKFNPSEKMTVKEFSELLGKSVYGADRKLDYVSAAKADGLFPKDFTVSDKKITAGEAVKLLANIVNSEKFKIIPLFVTSDIHGHLYSYPAPKSEMKLGGMSRISTLVNEGRKRNESTMLLDSGDSPYNTNLTNLFMGKPSVDVMNEMKYDATVLGNHDFDFVFENLLELAERADYKMLSANTYMMDGSYPKQFKPYYVTEKNGVKVAVVGLTDDTSKLYTHFSNTENIQFKDQFEVGKDVISKASAESDLVIVLSHLHSHNPELLKRVEGIDVSVGGGNDIFGRPEYVGNSLMINPGAHSASVTQVNVNMYNGKMIGYTANQFAITEAVEKDEKVQKIVDDYSKKMGELMGEKIGTADDDFVWSAPLVRTQENGLANVVADSQREYMGADIALQNGGGVRAAITKGDVTLNSVFTALPFDNRLVLIETDGHTIRKALEHGVSRYPATAGQFLQVSGIRYEFDGSMPPGSRIQNVKTADGKAFDLNKTYKVVINDFMAGGGDGYSMFNVLNPNSKLSADSKLVIQTNDYIRDVLVNHVKKYKTIKPVIEGRIKINNPQANNSKI